ncbi:DUF2231 domain-containing protein [Corynebacterium epidermidicanis]|uniref:DUF2231 domain-containing protein n=1 Tax=Corynebacterium epidermidicanis TaxID=1050174 RepID=A0A0G3GLR7_9CORY|nr:DUF2231 domain-containing protein [Corynebacterium epidermidicanis]AKK02131.1 hypothetical protein CEPID_01220 [Corynebacterium epidermidicanis]
MSILIGGIPAHPLIVHAAVILVPIAALVAAWAATKPSWHRNHAWLTSILGVGTAAIVVISNNTGEGLMVAKGATEANPGIYGDHAMKAKFVLIAATVVAISVVVKHLALKFPQVPVIAVTAARVLAIVAAVVAVISVILTGHAGAALVWDN